jgi:hypothetical protein
MGLSAQGAIAATLNNHFESDLENYRACKVDANGNRLSTCSGNDVRSGSKFHLTAGTQGSVTVTSNGTVKARIDGIAIDNGVSYTCSMHTNFLCDLAPGPNQYRCKTGPKSLPGACGVPGQACACIYNYECAANACDAGPQTDRGCSPGNPDAACKSLANVTGIATLVLGGNATGIVYENGVFKFSLTGDNGDPANGCTALCTMNTNEYGKVNSDDLGCDVQGDAACTSVKPYHVVKVLDMDGKVLAVPSVGAATIGGGGFGVFDPAKYGDVCRGGSPPADCADDQ